MSLITTHETTSSTPRRAPREGGEIALAVGLSVDPTVYRELPPDRAVAAQVWTDRIRNRVEAAARTPGQRGLGHEALVARDLSARSTQDN